MLACLDFYARSARHVICNVFAIGSLLCACIEPGRLSALCSILHRLADLPRGEPDYLTLQCAPPASLMQVLQLDEPESASNGAQPSAGNGNGNGAAPSGSKGNGVGLAPLSQSLVSIHAGERAGRPRIEDMLTTPIALTSTYFFKDTAELIAYQEGRYGSYEYGRWGLERTAGCNCELVRPEYVLQSGQASIKAWQVCGGGGHQVNTNSVALLLSELRWAQPSAGLRGAQTSAGLHWAQAYVQTCRGLASVRAWAGLAANLSPWPALQVRQPHHPRCGGEDP